MITKLYHGSSRIITEPKILTQNRTLDFGAGFKSLKFLTFTNHIEVAK